MQNNVLLNISDSKIHSISLGSKIFPDQFGLWVFTEGTGISHGTCLCITATPEQFREIGQSLLKMAEQLESNKEGQAA